MYPTGYADVHDWIRPAPFDFRSGPAYHWDVTFPVRSTMRPIHKWIMKVLGPLILGGMLLCVPFYLFVPDLGNDPYHWINSCWFRLPVVLFLATFALIFSNLLSRATEWVELDGMTLVSKGVWSRKVRRESLLNLRKLHPNGCIEFRSGHKVYLEGGPSPEAQQMWAFLSWWASHGMRSPGA